MLKQFLIALSVFTLVASSAGCQATPGINQFEYSKTIQNGQPVVKVGFLGSKDSNITAGPQNQPGLMVDLEKGTIAVQNMTANGSTLAGINAPVLVQQSNNATAVALAIVGLVQSGAIVIPGVSGGGGIVSGGTTTPPADLTALKATLTARIDACPFLAQNPTLRDNLKAQVAAVNTAAGAAVLQSVVDALYKTAAVTP